MPQNESFYGTMRQLIEECRDAIGSDGQVTNPREYRFDIEFPDRRYAFQGYPEENRIFVGQYVGDRGVVWFDELNYDELHHGWRSTHESASDFVRYLVKKPSLTVEEAMEQAADVPQSGHKESATSLEGEPHSRGFAERVEEAPAVLAHQHQAPRQGTTRRATGFFRNAGRAYSLFKQLRSMTPTPWKLTKWAFGQSRFTLKNSRGASK